MFQDFKIIGMAKQDLHHNMVDSYHQKISKIFLRSWHLFMENYFPFILLSIVYFFPSYNYTFVLHLSIIYDDAFIVLMMHGNCTCCQLTLQHLIQVPSSFSYMFDTSLPLTCLSQICTTRSLVYLHILLLIIFCYQPYTSIDLH